MFSTLHVIRRSYQCKKIKVSTTSDSTNDSLLLCIVHQPILEHDGIDNRPVSPGIPDALETTAGWTGRLPCVSPAKMRLPPQYPRVPLSTGKH